MAWVLSPKQNNQNVSQRDVLYMGVKISFQTKTRRKNFIKMLIFHNLFYLGEYSIFAFDTIFEIFFFFKTDFSSSSILKQLSLIFINLNLILNIFSRTFQCEFMKIFVKIVFLELLFMFVQVCSLRF